MKPDEARLRGQESVVGEQQSDREQRTVDSCSPEPDVDDPRLLHAVREYTSAKEAGHAPSREVFLARYPAIAGPLAECLEALEFVNAVGPRLEEATPDGATPPTAAAPPVDLAIPLGDFRLLREIGHGGMGVVYEAEQLSLGRRIALKVLPFALTLDPRQLQRFKNEARAAAHLHHSNIVPIYSVGCERGVHFYAMQFIEGQPLSAVIAELRRNVECRMTNDERRTNDQCPMTKPPVPSADAQTDVRHSTLDIFSSLGIGHWSFFQTVARFGLQAALALEHAHQLGVVHRDIKPGNLLLDTTGHLWVADFGLAQFQSDAALTITGDLVGTLRYMSPEQALARRGVVDHRTDIYSLGATLYELLTLEPAFDGRDRQELLRQIAFEEPRPLRRQNRAIPVDLETIVLKAMAKCAEDRYATAQELVDDLQRFLEQKPIRARRPAPWERAAKWSRRHKALVSSAIVLLVLASVGFAISTLRIAREQAQTEAALQAEARQRELAESNFQQAREMLDFFAQVSQEELADKPAVQDVRRKLLEAALEYYQNFIDQHGNDPSIREELVASHLRVANILQEMGDRADALAASEQARQLQRQLVRDHPRDPEYRKDLLSMDHDLRRLPLRNQLFLLGEPSVQGELRLLEEQIRQVAELMERRRETLRDQHDLSVSDWQRKLDKLADQEKTLIEQLGPERQRRLEQIALQQLGAGALLEPGVVEALHLTPAQGDQIRALQREAHRPPRGGPRFGGRRPDAGKKPEDIRNSILEQALNVLSAEQREAWKQLIGEPFRGEIRRGPAWDYDFRPARNPRRPPPRPWARPSD